MALLPLRAVADPLPLGRVPIIHTCIPACLCLMCNLPSQGLMVERQEQ